MAAKTEDPTLFDLVEMLEFQLESEKRLAQGLKTSLEMEKSQSAELSSKLSRARMEAVDLDIELAQLRMDLKRTQNNFESEETRVLSYQ